MGPIVYGLCALASLLCAWLLFRAYFRSRYRLLLWSGLCFAVLTINSLILVLDKMVFAEVDLSFLRAATALTAASILLGGLIWDSK